MGGNFSRNTFDAAKHYVGVRLQQGVPLVDADWNEMEDIRRNELRSLVRWSIGDGIPDGNDGFRIDAVAPAGNDFTIRAGASQDGGRCFVQGWEAVIETDLAYSGQRLYREPGLPAQWQVDPLPALTTADSERRDTVYLDVWEREVDPAEDAALIDARIGVPTCVRRRREWVVRVSEASDQPPAVVPTGHAFYPLATLKRAAGSRVITAQQVVDRRFTGLTLVRSFGVTGSILFRGITAGADTFTGSINPGLGPGPLNVVLGIEMAGSVLRDDRGALGGDFPDVFIAAILDTGAGTFRVRIKAHADVPLQDVRVRWWAGMPSIVKPDLVVETETTVWIDPQEASVVAGTTLQLHATVSGNPNTAVQWSVNGVVGGNAAVGTISPAGLYAAPPDACVATVMAKSVAKPGKVATARVTVTALTVTIAPKTPQVAVGMTIDFQAYVNGQLNNQAVRWLVNDREGGDATHGTISVLGRYMAPTSVPSSPVTVKAVSQASQNKFDSATVTVTVISLSITPRTLTLLTNRTQQFAVQVSGTPNTDVDWLVNDVAGGRADIGTVSPTGLYAAPAVVPSPNPVTVKARLKADASRFATATITVGVVSLTLNATTVEIGMRQAYTFAATVTGTSNTAVEWSVNGRIGGDATVGTITAGGLFTAPASMPSTNPVIVRATSIEDRTKYASALVTVRRVTVSISPSNPSVNTGGACSFSARVLWTNETGVVWKVNGVEGGAAATGTISAEGWYQAPGIAATVHVSATSTADPSVSDQTSVTVKAACIYPFNACVEGSMLICTALAQRCSGASFAACTGARQYYACTESQFLASVVDVPGEAHIDDAVCAGTMFRERSPGHETQPPDGEAPKEERKRGKPSQTRRKKQ
jgi:hypothetical protein